MDLLKNFTAAPTQKIASILQRPLILFMIGMAMGIGALVPGITLTTIAFILGTYEPLLLSLKNLAGTFFKHLSRLQFKEAIKSIFWKFLLSLGSGILCAYLMFYKFIHIILARQLPRVYLYAFFLGMLLSSIKLLKRRVVYWKAPQFLFLIVGILTSFWAISERLTGFALVQKFFPFTEHICLGEFSGQIVAGLLFMLAFFIPGISIHSLFMACGMAMPVFSFYFFIGLLLGLVVFSRTIIFLMKKYRDRTLSFLLGTIVGSLPALWPFGMAIHRGCAGFINCFLNNRQFVFGLLFLIAGYFVFSTFQKWQKKEKRHLLIPE